MIISQSSSYRVLDESRPAKGIENSYFFLKVKAELLFNAKIPTVYPYSAMGEPFPKKPRCCRKGCTVEMNTASGTGNGKRQLITFKIYSNSHAFPFQRGLLFASQYTSMAKNEMQ